MNDLSKLIREFQLITHETSRTSHSIRWNKRKSVWAITFPEHYVQYGTMGTRGKSVRLTDETFGGLLVKAVEWMKLRDRLPSGYCRRETASRTK